MARGRRLFRLKQIELEPQVAARYLLNLSAESLRINPGSFPVLGSRELFGNEQPLVADVGTGTGEYIVELAASDPSRNFIGIEVSHRLATYGAHLAAQRGLANLRMLRANFSLLRPLLPAAGWARASLHFPDPEHKRRDQKRSVFRLGFLDAMAHVLQPDGELSIASDKHDFFLSMLAEVEKDGRFERAHPEAYLLGGPGPFTSRFQDFWERKGVTPLSMLFKKVA